MQFYDFLSIQVEILDLIENLTMEIYFDEGGILMDGINSDGQSFPIDKDVIFVPRMNRGFLFLLEVVEPSRIVPKMLKIEDLKII